MGSGIRNKTLKLYGEQLHLDQIGNEESEAKPIIFALSPEVGPEKSVFVCSPIIQQTVASFSFCTGVVILYEYHRIPCFLVRSRRKGAMLYGVAHGHREAPQQNSILCFYVLF